MFTEITVVEEIVFVVRKSRNTGGDHLLELQKQLQKHHDKMTDDDLRSLSQNFNNGTDIINVIIKSDIASSSLVMELLAKNRYDLTLCETAVHNHCNDEFIITLVEKIHQKSSLHAKRILRLVINKISDQAKILIAMKTKHDPVLSVIL